MSHFSTISNSTKFIIIVVLCCFRHQNYLFCSIYKIVLFRKRKYTYFTEIFLTCNYILIIDIMCLIIKIFFFSFIWSLIMSTMYGKSTHSAKRFPALNGVLKVDQQYNFAIITRCRDLKDKNQVFETFFFNPYAPLRSLFENSQ